MSEGRRVAISVLVILSSLVAMAWFATRDLSRGFFTDTADHSVVPFLVSTTGFALGVPLLIFWRGRDDGDS